IIDTASEEEQNGQKQRIHESQPPYQRGESETQHQAARRLRQSQKKGEEEKRELDSHVTHIDTPGTEGSNDNADFFFFKQTPAQFGDFGVCSEGFFSSGINFPPLTDPAVIQAM
ncbi:hypothetical protein, partial [Escherichia coli]|uniref:hypothetical protein n=1 Tax=Escherichia coli TaxID=562 RepID=UPI00188EFECD